MIKVLMTKVGLQMGYIFDKNYIARKVNRGRREHGMCCIPQYSIYLFKVLNVLRCLYNFKKSNLKCVTSQVVWQFVKGSLTIFPRYAPLSSPHI